MQCTCPRPATPLTSACRGRRRLGLRRVVKMADLQGLSVRCCDEAVAPDTLIQRPTLVELNPSGSFRDHRETDQSASSGFLRSKHRVPCQVTPRSGCGRLGSHVCERRWSGSWPWLAPREFWRCLWVTSTLFCQARMWKGSLVRSSGLFCTVPMLMNIMGADESREGDSCFPGPVKWSMSWVTTGARVDASCCPRSRWVIGVQYTRMSRAGVQATAGWESGASGAGVATGARGR